MNILENLKLLHRAWKYRYQADKAGIRFLMDHLHTGDTALDIGAHKGGYTYWMYNAVGKNGKVIAFEPQIKGAMLLRKLFPEHVVVEHQAVSDSSGKTELFIQPQAYDISFEASLSNQYKDASKELVDVITLDEYCRKHNVSPQFIKIDVEGNEHQVIRGAINTLTQYKPSMLMECEVRHIGENKMKTIFSELENLGYEGFFFFDGKVLPVKEFRTDVHQDTSLINKYKYANNFGFVNPSKK